MISPPPSRSSYAKRIILLPASAAAGRRGGGVVPTGGAAASHRRGGGGGGGGRAAGVPAREALLPLARAAALLESRRLRHGPAAGDRGVVRDAGRRAAVRLVCAL